MNEQGGTVSSADCRSEENGRNIITEFPGKFPATVHCRIVFAFSGDAIEQKLERISRKLEKEGASEISIAASVSLEGFSPTEMVPLSASWTAPSSDANE